MRTRSTRLLAGAAAAALLALPAAAASADSHEGTVTVLHGVPGVTVDVYVNGDLTLEDFEPGTVTDPLTLPAGAYEVEIYAADADPAADDAVISGATELPGGANASLVAHLTEGGTPTLGVFVNDISAIAAGEARVTARHAAVTPLISEDPDILVNGDAAATDVTNPMEFSTDVPAAAHDLAVNLAGTDTTVLSADGVELAEGTSTIVYAIVYAIGSAADDTLGLLVQSIGGLGSAPEGVPAGNAGLADGSRSGCSVPRAASRCRSVCSRPTAGAPWRRGSISPHAACWTSRSSRTTATPPTAATACCAAT